MSRYTRGLSISDFQSPAAAGKPARTITTMNPMFGNPTTSIKTYKKFIGNVSILLKWKRSVYKLLWKHMVIYAIVYIWLSILYEFILDEYGKMNFRVLAEHCSRYSGSINLMVLLGFFTSTAMQRLYSMQTPETDQSITVFIFSLKPDLPEGPVIIDQFVRWQLLALIFSFCLVSHPIRKIYPNLSSLQTAGLLTQDERQIIEDSLLTNKNTSCDLIVIDWILLLLKETFMKKRFFSEGNYLKNVDAITAFKKSCKNMTKFSEQNLSPALVQAVTLAVYCFGCVTIMARTFAKEEAPVAIAMITYIPVLPAMQFFIYFAWLCFGKAALDPFGEDEDDINVKHLAQSHVENSTRLKLLYNLHLANVFPDLPQKYYESVPL
ncbi:bestrophin-4-like isoform X1 [Daphnia pulex]|uniref:bestrophin-4-like isoform X1 n=2 Tax=Daphnia pulex TaxID=6669 RepID=UPI001EDDF5CF|nr:bestrophin-4-like isoform X1 [Daphnia pulex]